MVFVQMAYNARDCVKVILCNDAAYCYKCWEMRDIYGFAQNAVMSVLNKSYTRNMVFDNCFTICNMDLYDGKESTDFSFKFSGWATLMLLTTIPLMGM